MPLARKDLQLLTAVVVVVFIGIIMLSSASSVFAFERYGDSYYFVKRQILFGIIPGTLLAGAVAMLVNRHRLKSLVMPLFIASTVVLMAVLIPGVGDHLGRAQRWISIGGFLLQPSELMKLCAILCCALWLSRQTPKTLRDWKTGILPYLGIVALVTGLVILEPDMGTSLVLLSTLLGMLFLAGVPWQRMGMICGVGVLLVGLLVVAQPYRVKRLTTFLNPDQDVQGVSYHINQATVAISAGGVLGRGLGKSIQKFQYLPEVASDSLFAIMAEELGFLRVVAIIALLYWIILRCFRIASAQSDPFARLTASGIGLWLGIQTTINIGANVGLLPFTGVPLPLLSHGGTSMVVLLCGIAIVFALSDRTTLHAPLSVPAGRSALRGRTYHRFRV